MTDSHAKIAVLGSGSWGTALASLVARHGHPTVLWGRDAAVISAIHNQHENPRYLPGLALPENRSEEIYRLVYYCRNVNALVEHGGHEPTGKGTAQMCEVTAGILSGEHQKRDYYSNPCQCG